MFKKNDMIRLEVTGITDEGNGIGHYEGMAVFVPDTAVGDVAQVRLVKMHPRYAFGRLETLETPSPDRIEQDCPVGRRCGGCSLRHISYESEKRIKWQQVQDAFKRIGAFDVECRPLVSTDQTDGYRNKAMFPVQRVAGTVQIGFYAKRSHDVVGCVSCRLQPEPFSRIALAVKCFVEKYNISCYDETTGKGLVRHLYVRFGEVTRQIMVCLVINGTILPHSDALLRALERLDLPIACVALNSNTNNTNVILGRHTNVLAGRDTIEDVLGGVRLQLNPLSFYQVNHGAAELLYKKAAACAGLTGKETLIDLYCGAGAIGLSMAGQAKEVIGVESVPPAVEDASRNAAHNHILNARFICADAAQAAQQFEREGIKPDVVLVDPPRKGCEEQVLLSIAAMKPLRIVMISCNPATAARDCRRLQELGYALREITPFDLFPRTMHVETCVLLSLKNS